jgi:hypothetical protein
VGVCSPYGQISVLELSLQSIVGNVSKHYLTNGRITKGEGFIKKELNLLEGVSVMFILRKFTFWFSALSIIICLSDYLGSGIANIILSQYPPITWLLRTESFRNWMIDESIFQTSSVLVSFRFSAYLIHFCSFLIVGILLEYLIHLFRRMQKMKMF